MAESKKGKLANSFGTGSRKKTQGLPIDPDLIDKTTGAIHPDEIEEKPKKKGKPGRIRRRERKKDDNYVKTSFDMPGPLYDALQEHLFRHRDKVPNMRFYLLDLIKKDLNWKEIK